MMSTEILIMRGVMIMEEIKAKDLFLDNPLAAARLEKLTLEIEQLKNNNEQSKKKKGWHDRFTSYTPVLSVLIAVFGFLFGIYQYQRQQKIQQTQILTEQEKDRLSKEREQRLRIQSQIRSDVDQILEFTNDPKETVSKVLFLLRDIKQNLEFDNGESGSDRYKEAQRSITKTLAHAVEFDCNFGQQRDLDFTFTLEQNWDDYDVYFQEDEALGSLEYIVDAYIAALSHMYPKDPAEVRSLRYSEANGEINFPQNGKFDAAQERRFQDLSVGFKVHLDLVKEERRKTEFVKKFQAAICNRVFTKAFLGIDFDPKSDAEAFGKCPK
jgi:hypothetical protein